jgi:CRP/FNR family nitrogen fixation transcriptional regulator
MDRSPPMKRMRCIVSGISRNVTAASHRDLRNMKATAQTIPNRSSKEMVMFARVSAGLDEFPAIFGEPVQQKAQPIRINLNEFSYKKSAEIFGEKEPADYVYQVVTGAVRSYKLLSDGRRQIGAFHLAGDIFGLEIGTDHRFTAEAIIDTTVRLMKRRSLELVAESDAKVARNLLSMITSNLRHAEDHMLLLGRKTSLERVAAFLIEMDRRSTAAGILALPMCRRDIADYLGLTLETVSRALSRLHDLGVLGFVGNNQRQIVLLDREQLASLDLQH